MRSSSHWIRWHLALAALVLLASTSPAAAGSDREGLPEPLAATAWATPLAPPSAPVAAPLVPVQEEDEGWSADPVTPDFTIVSLPTPLAMPRYKFAFRVTHRFGRALNETDFGDALADAFGLDSGARAGLELRFAPFRRAQIGVFRTSDKTIDFFASYTLLEQGEAFPLSLSVFGSSEGTNNYQDIYSPALSVVLSHSFGRAAAIYLVPTWVGNTNPEELPGVDVDDQTFYLGIGARVRVSRGTFLTGEISPRLAGFKGGLNAGRPNYEEGKTTAAFGIERQVGGHVFQVSVANAFAMTPANIARGAAPGDTKWYLGFTISRKF